MLHRILRGQSPNGAELQSDSGAVGAKLARGMAIEDSVTGESSLTVTTFAQLSVPVATAKIVRFDAAAPADYVTREEDSYRLDLCLTPRIAGARGCFRGRWGPHRFEPIRDLFLLPPGHDLHVRSDAGQE